ncbi:hypothetical protein [Paraburkholderia sp. CNPSo 3281]|uniref:hypothetical protein n=1 Tax=Paraburkholderia sp. CNPSo 3281 TaxID=2940933 RepID=UPI0020B800D3|nr:hypothetical protein [Paraburkholderia sp. CNPSo 3281]MCP3720373.1 hypothetical protein [Paraburkholderia sp. CNPSo 3281]
MANPTIKAKTAKLIVISSAESTSFICTALPALLAASIRDDGKAAQPKCDEQRDNTKLRYFRSIVRREGRGQGLQAPATLLAK